MDTFVLQLFGDPEASAQLAGIDSSTAKGRTFEILRSLWLGLAERHPLVLVVEDLHWVDHTSEQFLATLADEVAGSRIFLLTTYRPGYTPPWIGKSYATQLALSPLTQEAGRELVCWTAELPDALTEEIVARGEGNPLFLEELAHVAAETGGGSRVPRTITEVLTARIDRLGDESKRLIQAAAVLGREFALPLLGAVLTNMADPGPHLQELKRLEFVHEKRGTSEPTFVFKHALTQAVAYESLLKSRRRDLHERAARALETIGGDRLDQSYELLAYHYSRSADQDSAAKYLILANRKAATRNAMEEAVAYFYQALATLAELPDTRENRVRHTRLVLDQTGEFHFLHRHREYYDLLLQLEPLIDQLEDDSMRGAYLARVGHREWTVLADYPRAEATLHAAAEICERTGNVTDAAGAYSILAWTYAVTGDYPLVDEYRDRALAKLERDFNPVWFNFAHCASICAYAFSGHFYDAKQCADTAILAGRSRSDTAVVSFNAAFAAYAFLEQRDWRNAEDYALLSLQEAPTVYFQGFPQAFLASHACSTGHLDQGLPVLEAVVPMIGASGHRSAWMLLAPLLADAYRTAGRHDAARALLEQIREAAETGHGAYFTARAHRGLGELDQSAAHLDRAIEVSEQSGSENELALALASRGRLKGPVGGRADHERALAIFESLGTFREPDRIHDELRGSLGAYRRDGSQQLYQSVTD